MTAAVGRPAISDRGLTLLLAAITAVAPMVMQIYLPALPSLAEQLGALPSTAQITFSAFVFAVGPTQLIYGPLADRYGRRNTALASLVIGLIGSLACALATSIGTLIAARVLQAIGSAGGMVISRAILSDRYGAKGMAARLSSVIAVIVVVPMIAPLFGGYLTEWFGWRSVFAVSAALIAVVTWVCWSHLPETLVRASEPEPFVAGALSVLKKPLFVALTVQSALSLAVFYTFISVVPYVMEQLLDYPPTAYGQFFIMLASGYLLGTVVSSRIASRAGILRMIQVGTLIGLCGGLWLFGAVFDGADSAWQLFLPMTLLAGANGFASPSMQSGAVLQTARYAGTASGIIGCSQQLLAGMAVQGVASWGVGTTTPLIVFILSASLFSAMITVGLSLYQSGRPPLFEH